MTYPAPKIPLSPVLSGQFLTSSAKKAGSRWANSILSARNTMHVTSGRAAIALALQHAGINRADEVLTPAYHCESMISPVRWCGAKPVFYRVNLDTSIDVEDIRNRITPRTSAILVTHYFGLIQDLSGVLELCNEHGLVLVEDCAHAFFGSRDGVSVGSSGDYTIASSMKFFPVFDGGVLASTRRNIDSIKLNPPPTAFEIKSILNVIQKSVNYGRIGVLGWAIKHLSSVADTGWRVTKKLLFQDSGSVSSPASSTGGYGLEEDWIPVRSSWICRKLLEHQNAEQISLRRRENYLKLDKALSDLPDSRPLVPALPDGVTPLVYALYVENTPRYFNELKISGVPVWRFGEFLDEKISEKTYPEAKLLSANVLQFPCHQELYPEEIEWMIAEIRRVFSAEAHVGACEHGTNLANSGII
jgi:perosamine synthetase